MKKVIAIVGMPGSGKSEAGIFFKRKEMPVLRFGSIVIEGLKQQGKEITEQNENIYRQNIRETLGMAAIAIKMLPQIKEALQEHNLIVLDGLYSWEEYLYLKEQFSLFILLCIYTRPTIRYMRLQTRQERPLTQEEAQARDISEIDKLNKGGPIAMTDYLIKNETTKEHLYEELEEFLEMVNRL